TKLEADPNASGDVVRQVVGTRELTVVIEVDGHPFIQNNGSAGTDQHAVAADLGTVNREAVSGATGEARNNRVLGRAELVLPASADLRYSGNVAYLPFIGGFCPESGALRLGILTRERQGCQRTGFGKAVESDVIILEAGCWADRQVPFCPVITSCD